MKVENKSSINIVKHIIIPLRFSRFAKWDYCGVKLGYFRVVRIKIKQAFFEIFGWMEYTDWGIMMMLMVYSRMYTIIIIA